MEQAEAAAIEQGCRYSLLSTLDFQWIDFYPRFGYQEVLRLSEFPQDGNRVYFTKELKS